MTTLGPATLHSITSKLWPIDTLKIDRSFINETTVPPSDAKIVETILLKAKTLGLNVVAEGAETEEQLPLRESFGCDQIQGFCYSPALPLDKLIEFLKEKSNKYPSS